MSDAREQALADETLQLKIALTAARAERSAEYRLLQETYEKAVADLAAARVQLKDAQCWANTMEMERDAARPEEGRILSELERTHNDLFSARAEVARLREALKKIKRSSMGLWVGDMARAALEEKP